MDNVKNVLKILPFYWKLLNTEFPFNIDFVPFLSKILINNSPGTTFRSFNFVVEIKKHVNIISLVLERKQVKFFKIIYDFTNVFSGTPMAATWRSRRAQDAMERGCGHVHNYRFQENYFRSRRRSVESSI